MSTVQVQPGKILTITAGGAVTSGSVQEVGSDFIGVALAAASGSGVDYPLALEGVFTVGKKTSETWAVGDKVYWDSANSWASKTYVAAAADAFLGVATAVAGSSATTGNVKLRGGAEAEVDLDDVVTKSLFDANTILYATTDNTPVALTVAASRHVGRAASGDIDDLTPSQSRVILATTSEAEGDELLGAGTVGSDRLVNAQLVGTQVATVATDNAIGGIPVVHMITIPAGAGDTSVNLTHKTRIFDVVAVKTAQAGLAGGTLIVKNIGNAISDAITWDNTVADKAVARAATIDDAYWDVAAGTVVKITTSQNQSDGVVFLHCLRVA